MADNKKEKLQLVDLAGIGNLLEHLVEEGTASCEERDKIIKRIAKGNDFADHTLPVRVMMRQDIWFKAGRFRGLSLDFQLETQGRKNHRLSHT